QTYTIITFHHENHRLYLLSPHHPSSPRCWPLLHPHQAPMPKKVNLSPHPSQDPF
ncbi:hypothetical protein BGW80DRAFT_1348495, partial [Lactifluus volemus]